MTAKEEDVAMREEMVVLPRLAPPRALNTPVIVEEPVTARAEEVAPVAESAAIVALPKVAPPRALNCPVMVEDPVTARADEVAPAEKSAETK